MGETLSFQVSRPRKDQQTVSPPPRRLPLLLAAAVAWVGGPPVVAAASGWALQWRFPDGQPPPFTRRELEWAVSIRRPPSDAGADVAVGWDAGGSGRIEASSQSRRRLVRLDDAQGPDAARLVALAVVDVLRPLPELSELQAEPAAPAAPLAGLSLLGALNRGATSAGFALEPALRVAWPLGRRWGVAGEVGYGQGRGRADGQTLVLHMIPVRLGLQLRQGRWALTAAALAPLLLINTGFFVNARPMPREFDREQSETWLGRARGEAHDWIMSRTAAALREHEAVIRTYVETIRAVYEPGDVALLTELGNPRSYPWLRHAMYYLPEYEIYQLSLGEARGFYAPQSAATMILTPGDIIELPRRVRQLVWFVDHWDPARPRPAGLLEVQLPYGRFLYVLPVRAPAVEHAGYTFVRAEQ